MLRIGARNDLFRPRFEMRRLRGHPLTPFLWEPMKDVPLVTEFAPAILTSWHVLSVWHGAS